MAGATNDQPNLKKEAVMTTETIQATLQATLSEYDFIVVVDKSGSMGTEDMPGGRSRWDYMQETATAFARDLAKIDSDGLGLVLFSGASIVSEDGVGVDRIKAVFDANRPSGGTPLAEALEAALKLAGKSDKKDFIVVFTDGVPDDKSRAAQVIIDASNKQETDDALTILFVQVGKDVAATKYLQDLDDNLKGAKFDIVDAKTMDQVEQFASTAELIVHAIND
jgi:Mg-chelatase subunit ChlD